MQAILIRIGIAAVLLAVGATGGYRYHAGRVAEEQVKQLEAARAEQDRLTGIAQDLGQALAREARQRADDRVEWRKRLKEAEHAGTLVSVDCPGTPGLRIGSEGAADGRAVVRLSGEFVGLWNAALFRGSPASDPGRADDAAGGSGATPAEALDNLDENGERWAACRADLRWWQAFARAAGWVKSE